MEIKVKNLFKNLPDSSLKEQTEQLHQGDSVCIERIVSKGQVSAEGFWYDQDEDEFVLLLKGQAKLLFEIDQREQLFSAGDYLVIPAHCRHRVSWTLPETETIWLAIFSGS